MVGRLASGEVILGDGSYIMTLEKRGYATAGSWTPEAAAEHPEAIEQVGMTMMARVERLVGPFRIDVINYN